MNSPGVQVDQQINELNGFVDGAEVVTAQAFFGPLGDGFGAICEYAAPMVGPSIRGAVSGIRILNALAGGDIEATQTALDLEEAVQQIMPSGELNPVTPQIPMRPTIGGP
jgi:hypothetical protein